MRNIDKERHRILLTVSRLGLNLAPAHNGHSRTTAAISWSDRHQRREELLACKWLRRRGR
eukprot:244631-Amorphochlora_amoeboformis.AAC.1